MVSNDDTGDRSVAESILGVGRVREETLLLIVAENQGIGSFHRRSHVDEALAGVGASGLITIGVSQKSVTLRSITL